MGVKKLMEKKIPFADVSSVVMENSEEHDRDSKSSSEEEEKDESASIEKEEEKLEEIKHEEQDLTKLECLNSNLTSKEVSASCVQYLVVNIEEMTEPLDEQVTYQIDSIRREQFFSPLSENDLLANFPLLKMVFHKYVPTRMSEDDFWQRFIWFVHYYNYCHHKQDFSMEEIPEDRVLPKDETPLLLDDDFDDNIANSDTEESDNVEIIQLDYHSVNRYIASAILAFLKVFIVCAVLSQYNAPWYYYLYPALWVAIGLLIILRALQIQRKNNIVSAKLKESLEQGIELKEMESV